MTCQHGGPELSYMWGQQLGRDVHSYSTIRQIVRAVHRKMRPAARRDHAARESRHYAIRCVLDVIKHDRELIRAFRL